MLCVTEPDLKKTLSQNWGKRAKNRAFWQGLKQVKPGASRKLFDQLSRLIERFLHADSDGIIFYSTMYLWHANAGGPLQLYLARVFRKNFLLRKNDHKTGFFR